MFPEKKFCNKKNNYNIAQQKSQFVYRVSEIQLVQKNSPKSIVISCEHDFEEHIMAIERKMGKMGNLITIYK